MLQASEMVVKGLLGRRRTQPFRPGTTFKPTVAVARVEQMGAALRFLVIDSNKGNQSTSACDVK